MARYYQKFSVTGSANSVAYDTGISSTATEKRHLVSMLCYVSGQAGNYVRLYEDREKVVDIPDYLLLTDESTGGANTQKSTHHLIEIPVDREIPIGTPLKAAISCGATAKNLFGAYVYERK